MGSLDFHIWDAYGAPLGSPSTIIGFFAQISLAAQMFFFFSFFFFFFGGGGGALPGP